MKKILFVGSEAMPFAATGGLGDVLSSLPVSLSELSRGEAEISVIMPLYSSIPDSWRKKMNFETCFEISLSWRRLYCGIFSLEHNGVRYYFVDNEYYFCRGQLYGEYDDGERFAFFCKAVMEFILRWDQKPDVLHAHDWQSSLCTVYYARKYKHLYKMSTVFTIHNIEYQGKYDMSILGDVFDLDTSEKGTVEYDGCINLMKAAIECSDKVTTVSPRYANEIMTPEYSSGLSSILQKYSFKVCGILNGIDFEYYDPENDASIEKNYGKDNARQGKTANKISLQKKLSLPERKDVILISIISRLVSHKGLDLVTEIAESLAKRDIQFVVLGRGSERYESFFSELERRYPSKVRAIINYDRDLAKQIYAAADIFLMPSKSEPCGLSQMIASRYGCVPIVHAVGGLYDSIKNFDFGENTLTGNGFAFANYSSKELLDRIYTAIDLLENEDLSEKMIKKIMSVDFSFGASAEKYLWLYRELWG